MYKVTLYFAENKGGSVVVNIVKDVSMASDKEKSVVTFLSDIIDEALHQHPQIISENKDG